MQNENQTIAVVVISCDNYADLWDPFIESFRRFWADCPYPTYLVSNYKEGKYAGVRNVCVGPDVSWSDNLRKAVEQIPQEYVFIHIEDLFLCSPVNTPRVKEIFEWAVSQKANYVKMVHGAHNSKKPHNDIVNIIPKRSLYRASLVLCLFKKSVLLDLLKTGENAWEFEVHGSERSDRYDRFYIAGESCFDTINAIIKRKWQRPAVKKIQQLGIEINLSDRPVMTVWEQLKYDFLVVRTNMFRLVPAGLKRKIKQGLGGGKYK